VALSSRNAIAYKKLRLRQISNIRNREKAAHASRTRKTVSFRNLGSMFFLLGCPSFTPTSFAIAANITGVDNAGHMCILSAQLECHGRSDVQLP
jgi:hypothetical protein